ncbi:hypothetical protein [Streptomyces heilongjiangensis]|uniref:Uncharacterized protein n=1 Tax=Streptomyces heilongjiangensis TaxID=945052 RepID=A0ABW1BHJ7_9ACTN|nr:hypothetical protein [Streptomyces heilongjiangensis]MDC2951058.1 hypothetical protein [Streptomyces heilongjiangensis]
MILRFTEGGPAVTGEWEGNDTVARKTYKEWIGLYTHDPAVVVQFVADEEDGERRIIRKWVVGPGRSSRGLRNIHVRSCAKPSSALVGDWRGVGGWIGLKLSHR